MRASVYLVIKELIKAKILFLFVVLVWPPKPHIDSSFISHILFSYIRSLKLVARQSISNDTESAWYINVYIFRLSVRQRLVNKNRVISDESWQLAVACFF
jgi:hypothetical protein